MLLIIMQVYIILGCLYIDYKLFMELYKEEKWTDNIYRVLASIILLIIKNSFFVYSIIELYEKSKIIGL